MMEVRGDIWAFLVPADVVGARGVGWPLRGVAAGGGRMGPGLSDPVDRRPAAPPKRPGREYLRHRRIASPAVVLWQLLSLDYRCSITATLP